MRFLLVLLLLLHGCGADDTPDGGAANSFDGMSGDVGDGGSIGAPSDGKKK